MGLVWIFLRLMLALQDKSWTIGSFFTIVCDCDVQLYALPIVMLVQVLVPKAEVMNKIKQNKKKEASRIRRVKKGSSLGHRLE